MNSSLSTDVVNSTQLTLQLGACIKLGGFVYEQVYGVLASTSEDVIGIVFDQISPGKVGKMAVLGIVSDIDTSAYTPGTALYCGEDGYLTPTPNGTPLVTVLSKSTKGAVYVNCAAIPPSSSQITQLITNFVALLNKLDSDTGVSDTNYLELIGPPFASPPEGSDG